MGQSKTTAKPPIGLKPRELHDSRRLHEVSEAIARYFNAGMEISPEWVEEYNDLIRRAKK